MTETKSIGTLLGYLAGFVIVSLIVIYLSWFVLVAAIGSKAAYLLSNVIMLIVFAYLITRVYDHG